MANKKKPKGIGAALKGYGRALGIIDKPRKYETKTHIYEIDPGFLSSTIETIKKSKGGLVKRKKGK